MLRRRVILIAAAAAAAGLLVAGIVVWQLVWSEPRTVSVASEGAEIRFPEDAFDAEDARPTVSSAPADDEFLSVFGLTANGSEVAGICTTAPDAYLAFGSGALS